MRKPFFSYAKSKGTDQQHGNCVVRVLVGSPAAFVGQSGSVLGLRAVKLWSLIVFLNGSEQIWGKSIRLFKQGGGIVTGLSCDSIVTGMSDLLAWSAWGHGFE